MTKTSMKEVSVKFYEKELRLETHSRILTAELVGYPSSLELSHRPISADSSFSLHHGIKK